MSHTPGPWSVFETVGQTVEIGSESREIVCDISGLAGESFLSGGEIDANARLIASAPELLEALEGMLAFFSPKPGQRVVIDCVLKGKAAVAKAKGEL